MCRTTRIVEHRIDLTVPVYKRDRQFNSAYRSRRMALRFLNRAAIGLRGKRVTPNVGPHTVGTQGSTNAVATTSGAVTLCQRGWSGDTGTAINNYERLRQTLASQRCSARGTPGGRK